MESISWALKISVQNPGKAEKAELINEWRLTEAGCSILTFKASDDAKSTRHPQLSPGILFLNGEEWKPSDLAAGAGSKQSYCLRQ